MEYPFPLDLEQRTDAILPNLKSKTKESFQIKNGTELCDDQDTEFEIDDIDDLQNALEEKLDNDRNVKFDSQYTFDLFVKMEQLNGNNTPGKQFKIKQQLNNDNNSNEMEQLNEKQFKINNNENKRNDKNYFQ